MTPRLASVVFSLSVLFSALGADWAPPRPASVDELRLAGPWAAAQARAVARLGAAPLDRRDFILADVSLKQPRPFVEFSGDVSGRWIGAAAFLAPQYPQPLAAFPQILAEIPAYQKADGHFGADQHLPAIDRGRDMPILWGNGRLLLGLVEVFQRTGNAQALHTARRIGDYFVATDAVYNKPDNLRSVGGAYADGFATCYFSCIEGLAALGGATGEKRYLDEAGRIAELALSVDNFDGLHAHGRLCAVCGMAGLYAVTGQRRWLEGAQRDWRLFHDRYLLPTGGVKEVLAPKCDRDEGCAECDWLRLNLALWRLTGAGRYLDAAERVLKGHFLYQQFPNGGAGHRLFHQIDGRAVAFQGTSQEAWWCCAEHWPRTTAEVARHAVASGKDGPCINLAIDCEGTVAGPRGKWKVVLRESSDGLRIVLTSPAPTEATLRVHRPGWARTGARVEASGALSVRQTDDAWLLRGVWRGAEQIAVHLPMTLRCEAGPAGTGALLRGHDLLAAHRNPVNAWLLDRPGDVWPMVLWAAALRAVDGRILVPASLAQDPQPQHPEQWKLLELAPLRAVAGEPHEAAWFSFRTCEASAREVAALAAKIRRSQP
jgi:DUF1680 family protein